MFIWIDGKSSHKRFNYVTNKKHSFIGIQIDIILFWFKDILNSHHHIQKTMIVSYSFENVGKLVDKLVSLLIK